MPFITRPQKAISLIALQLTQQKSDGHCSVTWDTQKHKLRGEFIDTTSNILKISIYKNGGMKQKLFFESN